MEITLQMPSNYVEVTEDEMMYVDGGGTYLSRSDARNAIASVSMTPSTFIAAAVSVAVVATTVRWIAKRFGGIWGTVAGMIAGWAGGQVLELARGIGRGAINNGVTLNWNWNIFKDPIGVSYSVHY